MPAEHDSGRPGDRDLRDRRRAPARRPRAALRAVDAGEDQGELLPAQAGDDVALADDGAQALGDRAEDLVALAVAVGVVDRLEVVEVERDDG